MRPAVIITWFFGGMGCLFAGSYMVAGWAGILIVLGLFSVLGVSFDAVMRVARGQE